MSYPYLHWLSASFYSTVLAVCLLLCGFSCRPDDSSRIELAAEKFLMHYDPATAVVVDVRTRSEFDKGHLPEAIQLDFYAPDIDSKLRKLDKSRTYYVYCHSGARSRILVRRMRDQGFENSFNIRGGMLHLIHAGATFIK
jgi:rhodanese-related sulfurtransferase